MTINNIHISLNTQITGPHINPRPPKQSVGQAILRLMESVIWRNFVFVILTIPDERAKN